MTELYNDDYSDHGGVTPEEGIYAMLKLAEFGPVTVQTRRGGWSCDVWVRRSTGHGEPTHRAYGRQPHEAAAIAFANIAGAK